MKPDSPPTYEGLKVFPNHSKDFINKWPFNDEGAFYALLSWGAIMVDEEGRARIFKDKRKAALAKKQLECFKSDIVIEIRRVNIEVEW